MIFAGFCRFPDSHSAYGNEFVVSFAFRTEMKEGLFFFVHGSPGSYVVASLTTSGLVMEYKSAMMKSGRTITYSNAGIDFCDGTWQDVMFQKLGNQLTISVTNVGTVVAGNADLDANISISSELYIGGIPQNSQVEIYVQENGLVMPSEGKVIPYNTMSCTQLQVLYVENYFYYYYIKI